MPRNRECKERRDWQDQKAADFPHRTGVKNPQTQRISNSFKRDSGISVESSVSHQSVSLEESPKIANSSTDTPSDAIIYKQQDTRKDKTATGLEVLSDGSSGRGAGNFHQSNGDGEVVRRMQGEGEVVRIEEADTRQAEEDQMVREQEREEPSGFVKTITQAIQRAVQSLTEIIFPLRWRGKGPVDRSEA